MKFSLFEEDLKHMWEKGSRIWPKLRNTHIFLTGGTGFFGHWLLESVGYANAFYQTNIHVKLLTTNISAFLNKSSHFSDLPWLSFLEGDIRTFEFPKDHFTYIIHAATPASAEINQNQPLLMIDTIIEGTKRILNCAHQLKVKKILLVSSGAVYGRQPETLDKIPETWRGYADPLDPKSAYSIGKLTAEHLAALYARYYHLNISIARCFAFVGPYLPLTKHFAIGNFIANALEQKPISIAGDGSPYRSYLYAADLAIWLWTILCFSESSTVYNVGSENAISIVELANLISTLVQPALPITIAKKRDLSIAPARYVPATKKAEAELNLQQWIDLPTAISRTLEWSQSYAKTEPICC